MILLNKRNPEIYEHRYIRCKRIWKPDLYMIGQIINQALENAKKKMQELKLYMNLIGCEVIFYFK